MKKPQQRVQRVKKVEKLDLHIFSDKKTTIKINEIIDEINELKAAKLPIPKNII